jgi:hypothetical protein
VTITAPATVHATSYVAPLREGGSLPGLVEADDDGLYVVKFRGAGQGPKALVAELLAAELGRLLELPVPRFAFVDVDPVFARAEPDPEIQDLIKASAGVNAGLDFLPGSLAFDVDTGRELDPALAAAVVWFDSLLMNVDRTPRNPNLLVWHGRLWLIDHGAALYLHHGDWRMTEGAARPFPAISQHVLMPFAGSIAEADARLAPLVERGEIDALVALLPDAWLEDEPTATPSQRREQYAGYLEARLAEPREFAEEAERARLAA